MLPTRRFWPQARSAAALVAACVCLAACAPMIPVSTAMLTPTGASSSTPAELRLACPVDITRSTGYRRTLTADSRWRHAGVLPQGDVYRPVSSVFSIEGRQVHEAWLVVSATTGALVGFYLPGESGYSPLPQPLSLPTTGDSR